MLTYSFENIDTESMYEHLYRCIKQDILQKKLRAGEKLPSKRTFAKNLGVSTITVESAYAQLVAEGFLYTLPKRGYYVCELEREEPVAPLPPRPKGPAPREPDKRAYWADCVGSSGMSQRGRMRRRCSPIPLREASGSSGRPFPTTFINSGG